VKAISFPPWNRRRIPAIIDAIVKKSSSHNLRRQNLELLGRELRLGKERTGALPAVLYLEATATCNLKCPMCPTTMGLPRDPYRTKLLDLELLPRLEPALPFVARCFLSGGGEPLLHPRLFELVRELKRHEIEVHFNCNATLLDQERARLMIESGVDTVSFSIDGATAETYEKIRVGAEFEKTLENLRRLSRLKSELKSRTPFMNLQFTLLDQNVSDLEGIAPLAASLGINHLVIEPLTPVFCFDDQYRAFYQKHRAPPELVLDRIRKAEETARSLGLVFSSHYLFSEDHPEPARTCIQPWLTFGVRVDGRVFTCCGTLEPMGDLAEDSFDEIWNGPAYRELRRTIASGRFPEFCSHCIAENRANHFSRDLVPE